MEEDRNRTLYVALALLLPFAACGVQWHFWSIFTPFVWFLFFPTVFFSSRIGGKSAGLISTVISSVLVVYFFIPPQLSFAVKNPNNLYSVVVFLIMGCLFSYTHDRLERANRRAAEAHEAVRIAKEQIQEERIGRLQTEQQQIADNLVRSEAKYRNLFNAMDEGFCIIEMIFDAEGRPVDYCFLTVNAAFEKQTGLHEAEGKFMRELAPAHEAHWFEIYGKIALTGEPAHFVNEARALNRWYDVYAYRVGGTEDRQVAIVFNDISERMRAEEETRLRNRLLEQINRILRESLICETEEQFGEACLRVAEEITGSRFGFIGEIGADGLLHDFAISNPGWELCTIHDKTGQRRPPGDFHIHGLYGRVILDGKGFFTNTPSAHPDSIGTPAGHPPLTAFLGVPLFSGEKTFGMIAVGNREGGYSQTVLEMLETITPIMVEALLRKRTQEEILRLKNGLEERVEERTAELLAANRELDAFAYAVSHDLRAPLRAMNGFSQALEEDFGEQLHGEAHVYLEQITHASRHMGQLIDGLLTLSRCTRGDLLRDQVDLSHIAKQAGDELVRLEPERPMTWQIEPGMTARGDVHMLEVVMRNLINNAWKYTSGTLSPLIRVYTEERDGAQCFCVADNGAGFDMGHSQRLFKPFQRLHRQDEFPGIGIGLATVQRIIHRHGGEIRAEALPGKGALFCFTLDDSGVTLRDEG